MNIKDLVKNKKVNFLFYKEKELWYEVCGYDENYNEFNFHFPVPIDDVGTAAMMKSDKAILYICVGSENIWRLLRNGTCRKKT